jgi:pimeloyl-ACP methyl ester carboxylesterase
MPSFRTSDEVTLHYSIQGKGKPLLFLNGLFGEQAFWEPVSTPLSAQRQCILLDHRGIGDSERWVGPYSYELWARDSIELLDHLKITSLPVLGLCHGGMVAAVMAQRHPGRINGFVTHGTRLLESPKTRVYDTFRQKLLELGGVELVMMAQMGSIFGERTLAELEPYVGKMSANAHQRMSPESSLGMLKALSAFHLTPEILAKMDVPALFLAGEEDLYVPPWMARRTASAWPNSRFHEIPQVGHILPREAPEEMVQHTLAFLKDMAI